MSRSKPIYTWKDYLLAPVGLMLMLIEWTKKPAHLLRQLRVLYHVRKYDVNYCGNYIIYKGISFKSHPSPHYLRRLPSKAPKHLIQTLFDIYYRYREVKEVRPGDTVIEVGAYVGFRAMKMAETAKKVIAIEADPDNYMILCENVSQFKNIEPVFCAISDYNGMVDLYRTTMQANSIVGEGIPISVPCQTLDSFKGDFIRIQTNGAELKALEGLTYYPRLLVAAFKNRKEINNLLISRGYKTTYRNNHIYAELNNS